MLNKPKYSFYERRLLWISFLYETHLCCLTLILFIPCVSISLCWETATSMVMTMKEKTLKSNNWFISVLELLSQWFIKHRKKPKKFSRICGHAAPTLAIVPLSCALECDCASGCNQRSSSARTVRCSPALTGNYSVIIVVVLNICVHFLLVMVLLRSNDAPVTHNMRSNGLRVRQSTARVLCSDWSVQFRSLTAGSCGLASAFLVIGWFHCLRAKLLFYHLYSMRHFLEILLLWFLF